MPSSGRTPGKPFKIYLVPFEGGELRQLLPGEVHEADPGWSPDGKSLIFGRVVDLKTPSENIAIHLLDLDKFEISTLADSQGLFSPRWSSDGRYVAALSSGHPKLMLFDFRTREWVELAGMQVGFPNWSRDSRYVYFESSKKTESIIYRIRISDRKLELVADRTGFPVSGGFAAQWLGLALDDSPVIMHNTSSGGIFSLECDLR